MEISELLNADLGTVGRLMGRGLVWWRNELLAMVPERWRQRSGGRARVVIRPEGEEFLVERPGVPDALPLGTLEASEGGQAVLCLPRSSGLSRCLDLPPLPVPDLRQMIALDIDRLTPFEAGDVFFDFIVAERDASRQRVEVGFLPRDYARAMLERLEERGVSPGVLALADEDGQPRFDFLPLMRNGKDSRHGIWTQARLWGVAAALLVLNVGFFVTRDVMSLLALREQVEAQKPMVQAAEKIRATVEAEEARKGSLSQRRQFYSPLPILDNLTRSLPDAAWIQHLEWDGSVLRISGWSQGGTDVLALVERTPLLTNARAATPAEAFKPPFKPFEITAQRVKKDGS